MKTELDHNSQLHRNDVWLNEADTETKLASATAKAAKS